jgi:uncharacterized protein (TIGR03437 family)
MHGFIPYLVISAATVFAQPGTITTFAGAYADGFGGPARQAALNIPGQMAQDQAGNVYICGTARIYRLTPGGIIESFAGTGISGFSGDNGPATQAQISAGYAAGIVIDSAGNVIFADNHRIRQVTPGGIIRTIAGNGGSGFSGDGGPALSAQIGPQGLALDQQGNLYFADYANYRIRKIDSSGKISTVAGNGTNGYSGDGGPATQGSITSAGTVAVDSGGNLFIGDRYNGVIRRVDTNGVITTVAGRNQANSPQRDANGRNIDWTVIFSITFDRFDNLYMTVNNRVLKRDSAGTITFVVGAGFYTPGDYQGPAASAPISTPRGLLIDAQGNLLVAVSEQAYIAKVDNVGVFTVVAGANLAGGAAGPPAFARFIEPAWIAFSPSGSLYALEGSGLGSLRKLTTPVTILNNVASFNGGVAFDAAGNFYYSDWNRDTVQRIDLSGQETTFAGTASSAGFPNLGGGPVGDGGPATNALLLNPRGVAFDSAGALYIADTDNERIRKVTPDGIIQTVAGTGTAGFTGDGGPATAARINSPNGVAVDAAGNLYFTDGGNARVRRISNGIISTIAGTGQAGTGGDGGPATAATIGFTRGIAVEAVGNVYFSDSLNKVRKISTNGIISTVAGNGVAGMSGDGGPAAMAKLANPSGLAIDANGNVYIADTNNNRIRKVQGNAPFNVSPLTLLYSTTLGSGPKGQTVSLTSSDGAARRFQASGNIGWLTVSPSTGDVAAGQPAALTVTANPSGLSKGTYAGTVTVLDQAAGVATQIPVTLTVSGTAQQLRLSQVGLTFTAIQGGASPAPQSVQVLNSGTGIMPWTAKPATLAGGAWLSVSPSSGTTTVGATPPSVNVSVVSTSLPAGSYYGQVDLSAPSADNSPQSAVALLNVLPPDGTPGPQLTPSGLLFTAVPGATPAAQAIEIFNPATRSSSYTISVRFTNGSGWLTAPAPGTLTAGQRLSVDVQPRATSLAAGVYRATLTLTFTPENISRTVDIALVVNAAASGATAGKAPAAGTACTATQLVAVLRRPGASYQTAAGWPVPVEVAVADDCGAPLTAGRVVTTFSTNDPQLGLLHTGNGIWQGTWASRTTTAAVTVTIKVQAESADQKLTGQTQVAIKSDLNPDQPSIAPGGVLNAASFKNDTPVSPGEYVSVFGSRLAKDFAQAGSLPLPSMLGDTLVAIGGVVAPLHFASDGQVNAVLPYRIPDSTTLQMIVRRGNVLSVPESVLIGATQPAVFTIDGSGTGQGHIYGATAAGVLLADNAHPLKGGDTIVVLATGLGLVNPPVEEGKAAPSDPLSVAVKPIEVTIQGKKAQVVFAGLAPGFAGVFQVNAIVPADLAADPAAVLIVIADGQPSPPTTLAVTNN